MPLHYGPFEPLDPLPAHFANAIQQLLSSLGSAALGVRINPSNSAQLQIPAGSGDDQVGITIGGRWRYNTSSISATSSGSAGLRDVFVTAADNSYSSGTVTVGGDTFPVEDDGTDYSFALAIVTSGGSPSGVALARRVAVAVWDGARFTAVAPVVGGAAGSTDKTNGTLSIATEESRTNTAFGTLTTPDVITGIVVPDGAILQIRYWAAWKKSASSNARAAIFIGSNQLKQAGIAASPGMVEASLISNSGIYRPLVTDPRYGLVTVDADGATASNYTGDVTTGQMLGGQSDWNSDDSTSGFFSVGGAVEVFVAAGTYDVSVQFKADVGSISAKNRRLWVRVIPFS